MSMKEWYREVYLRSSHWSSLRKRAKKEYGEKCNRCPRAGTDVHHKRYKYIYDVTVEDLEVVCRACHDLEHDIQPHRKLPKAGKPKKKLEKMPPRPEGVSRNDWHAWVMGGQRGSPPEPKKPKKVEKEWARPPGVPRKAWAEWVTHGRIGGPPQPVKSFNGQTPRLAGQRFIPLRFHPKKQKKLFRLSPGVIDLRLEADRKARLEAARWA
jgi:hypothetical protein